MTDNNSDSIGQDLGANPGSRERGQEVVPALTGFDPARDDETERLRDLLDTERYKVAIALQAILKAVQSRQWLSEPGRGSYAYDDERYQQEFGQALGEIEEALEPLRSIARDWSDCPTDPLRVASNRKAAVADLTTKEKM